MLDMWKDLVWVVVVAVELILICVWFHIML